jgi:hypothetical protein
MHFRRIWDSSSRSECMEDERGTGKSELTCMAVRGPLLLAVNKYVCLDNAGKLRFTTA